MPHFQVIIFVIDGVKPQARNMRSKPLVLNLQFNVQLEAMTLSTCMIS